VYFQGQEVDKMLRTVIQSGLRFATALPLSRALKTVGIKL
jgi:hypothetical protein